MITLDQAQEAYDNELPDDDECNCDNEDQDVICSNCGEHSSHCADHGGTHCCGARPMFEKEYEKNED